MRSHLHRAGASTSTPVSGGLSTRTGIIIAGVVGGISGLALLWVGICLFSRRAERQPDPPAAPVEPKAPESHAPPFMEQPLKSTALPLVSHSTLLPFCNTLVMQAGVRACYMHLHSPAQLHVYSAHRTTACCVQGSVAVSADANGTDDISAAAHARALEVHLLFQCEHKNRLFSPTWPYLCDLINSFH